MPPLQREHTINGSYTLKGGKLTFRTATGLLGYDARLAIAEGRTFTVRIAQPDGLKEMNGKVLSVELLEHMKPLQYEIVIRLSA